MLMEEIIQREIIRLLNTNYNKHDPHLLIRMVEWTNENLVSPFRIKQSKDKWEIVEKYEYSTNKYNRKK